MIEGLFVGLVGVVWGLLVLMAFSLCFRRKKESPPRCSCGRELPPRMVLCFPCYASSPGISTGRNKAAINYIGLLLSNNHYKYTQDDPEWMPKAFRLEFRNAVVLLEIGAKISKRTRERLIRLVKTGTEKRSLVYVCYNPEGEQATFSCLLRFLRNMRRLKRRRYKLTTTHFFSSTRTEKVTTDIVMG